MNEYRRRSSAAPTKRRKPNRRFPPEVLSPTEVKALMDACGESPAGLRNRALLAVLYRAGLRIAEARSLRVIDVDQARGAIRVMNGKGGSSRTVGMDRTGFEVLSALTGAILQRSIGIRMAQLRRVLAMNIPSATATKRRNQPTPGEQFAGRP
ncbi:MAG: tyrosine-type recombinase/integrase [Phycisphaerales bacterium]